MKQFIQRTGMLQAYLARLDAIQTWLEKAIEAAGIASVPAQFAQQVEQPAQPRVKQRVEQRLQKIKTEVSETCRQIEEKISLHASNLSSPNERQEAILGPALVERKDNGLIKTVEALEEGIELLALNQKLRLLARLREIQQPDDEYVVVLNKIAACDCLSAMGKLIAHEASAASTVCQFEFLLLCSARSTKKGPDSSEHTLDVLVSQERNSSELTLDSWVSGS